MIRAIILETSGSSAQVGLAEGQGVVAVRSIASARRHGRDVAPVLESVLQEAGWATSSIDVLTVDHGPGSYTGLRVGVVIAKTLAYALDRPIVAVDSMSILFEQAPAQCARVSAIVDAQQGRVYAATSVRSRLPDGLPEIAILPAEDWARTLDEGTYVTGPALERFRQLVPASLEVANEDECNPKAAALWSVAHRRYEKGAFDDAWSLEPLYLRPSSAQEKWDKRLADGINPA